jgi:hypothetical protein
LVKALRGDRVQHLQRERIRQALAVRGWAHMLPTEARR